MIQSVHLSVPCH